MKGSLIVVAFFVLGLIVGHSGCLPSWFMSSQTSFVALCALLLFVCHRVSPSCPSSPYSARGWVPWWLMSS